MQMQFYDVYKISGSEDSKDLMGQQNIEMVILLLIGIGTV